MPATRPSPPYQPGDKVRALYFSPGVGTTLGPIEVTTVTWRPDGWAIEGIHPDTGVTVPFSVDFRGLSDYVSGREPNRALLDEHRLTLVLLGWDERGLMVNDVDRTVDCLMEDIAGTDSPEEIAALVAAVRFVESRRVLPPTRRDTICDRCGDVSNSVPGLPCGRVEEDEATGAALTEPCTGTYR